MKIVGIISDTHGLLRPSALAALSGCDTIVHAGDIGRPEVLEVLRTLAPVKAVRGNVDRAWAHELPDRAVFAVEGRRFLVLHDVKDLLIGPRTRPPDVVVSGHSHRPAITRKGKVLYVNPGSAGPRRFSLPIALVKLRVSRTSVDAEIVELAG